MSGGVMVPPAMIGVLGSGQLGRMLAQVARQMGFGVTVFSPGEDTPAGQVATVEVSAGYGDLAAVRRFAEGVDVVTYEFENVPLATVAAVVEAGTAVHPAPMALQVAQNRLREKRFFEACGLPVADFAAVESLADLHEAIRQIGLPAVLKTAESGYDGKGQVKILAADEAESAWLAIGQRAAILEAFVPFEREISVVVARGSSGEMAHYGIIENEHANHILDVSVAPAVVDDVLAETAVAAAQTVIEKLGVQGVVCVEFFVTAQGLLLNEMAPRPHNSGHLTIEGFATSQFEQQLRAICGWRLGSTRRVSAVAMANLLGEVWLTNEGRVDWSAVGRVPGARLHLYGKGAARPGRKMGHITATGRDVAEAKARVLEARRRLDRDLS